MTTKSEQSSNICEGCVMNVGVARKDEAGGR